MKGLAVEARGELPDKMARRLMQQAHNQDGLPEIAIGVVLLLGSGISWTPILLEAHSVGRTVATFGFMAMFIVFCLTANAMVRWARQRWLLERVGYMKAKPNRKGNAVAFAVAMGVACLAALVLYKTRAQIPERWPLLAIGASFCIFETVLVKLPRFYVSGVLALAAAVALAWSGLRLDVSVALLLDIVGVLALVNGCVALMKLLRQPVESGQ